MIVVQCVDNRNGTRFNGRRQSRDRLLRRRVLEKCRGRVLWMDAASFRQFQEDGPFQGELRVAEDFLSRAGSGEVCFVEGLPLAPWLEQIEAVVLYRWNRDYPADVRLDWDLAAFRIAEAREFPGRSHPRITRTIYVRKERSL